MSVRMVPVQRGELAAETTGAGPDIVFVHGFSLDRRSWQPQIAHFAKAHRVTTYDLRGFGQSSLPDGEYEHGDDLLALMDALGIEKALLVGLSLGANVAMTFAARYPQRLSGLVLASPGLPGHPWKTERPPEAAARVAAAEGVEAGKRFWLDHPLFANLARAPHMRDLIAVMVRDYSAWHWQGEGRGARLAPLPSGLEGILAPTLVISGRHDVDGYREIARHIADRIAGAQFAEMAEGGHMANMDAADAFTSLVEEFSRRLPQDGR